MKKAILTLKFIIIVTTVVLTSCDNNSHKSSAIPAETKKDQYRCPMKCSEELFDKPGKCPVCEMELEKVIKS